MKNKMYLAIILACLLAFNAPGPFMNTTIHEIIGLALAVFLIGHIVLNFKWIKHFTTNLFHAKTKTETRITYVLNIILLIAFIGLIFTGISISESLFPDLLSFDRHTMRELHETFRFLVLGLVVIHLFLQRKLILNFIKQR